MRNTILVVDDNSDVRYSVIDLLKKYLSDTEFIEAENGAQALYELKTRNIDLAILDIMMPEIDGWDVAANIKLSKNKNMNLIFLTAKKDFESRAISQFIAADYIEKPFNSRYLVNKVISLLQT